MKLITRHHLMNSQTIRWLLRPIPHKSSWLDDEKVKKSSRWHYFVKKFAAYVNELIKKLLNNNCFHGWIALVGLGQRSDITHLDTLGRTPPDEWSVRRRDLYLTTHSTHNKQISTPPVGIEPTISATGISNKINSFTYFQSWTTFPPKY